MKKNYWQFILGLQHNAQRYFENQITLYEIQYDWSSDSNQLFMIRDFETNELIYDSVGQFIVDMGGQQTQHCKLIPFHLLFPNFTTHFKQFNFESTNYPLAVFLGENESFALVNIQNEIVRELKISWDPREFSGFTSTQTSDKFYLFTLIKLDQKQQQVLEQFIKPQNWKEIYKNIKTKYIESKFNFKQDTSFTLVNNLVSNDGYDSNFLQNPKNETNLAFSLINKLISLQDMIDTEKYMSRECRSSFSTIIDRHYDEICLFQNQLNDELSTLISHTANNYENAYVDLDFNSIPPPPSNTNSLDLLETENNNEKNDNHDSEKTTSFLESTTYLILFIIISLGLLYGVFWLVSNYAFAKFTFFAILCIIVLSVWARK